MAFTDITQFSQVEFYEPVRDQRTGILWDPQLLRSYDGVEQLIETRNEGDVEVKYSSINYVGLRANLPPLGAARIPGMLIGFYFPHLSQSEILEEIPSLLRLGETRRYLSYPAEVNHEFPLTPARELDQILQAFYGEASGLDIPIVVTHRLTPQRVYNFLLLHPQIHDTEMVRRLLNLDEEGLSPIQRIMIKAVDSTK